MKIQAMFGAISIVVVSFALPVTEVSAEYPPIDDVKRSSVIPSISYDRHPHTPNPDARRIVVAVGVGQQTKVVTFLNEAVTLVISSVGKGKKFTVQIKDPNGRILVLPDVCSGENGNVRLPTLAFSSAGVFKLQLTDANGKGRTISIPISK